MKNFNHINMLIVSLITLLVLGFTQELSAGENSNGGTAGAFRRIGHSARLMGMGNCALAFPAGAESRQYNPASIAWFDKKIVSLDMLKLSLDRKVSAIHGLVPLKPIGAIGMSWTGSGVSGIPETTTYGEYTGNKMEYTENLFSMGVAIKPSKYFSIGLGVGVNAAKFNNLDADVNSVNSTSAGFDLGVVIHPHQNAWIGLSLRNLAASYDWDSSPIWDRNGEGAVVDEMPTMFGFGTGMVFLDGKLLALLEYESSSVDAWDIRTGVEYRGQMTGPNDWALRAGWDDGSLTFGGGFIWKLKSLNNRIDYAVIFHENDPEEIHSFTWTFEF
jgi:hypothetical protein